jgi:hypothetical protein
MNINRLNKSLIFISVFLIHFLTSAQNNSLEDLAFYSDSSIFGNPKLRVTLQGNYFLNASSIPNYFLGKALYESAYLDDDIKQTAIARLKSRNRIGLEANAGLNVAFVKNDIRYSIGIGHKEFLSMKFTEDMFRLIFLGNKDFLDKTADVSNIRIKTFNYQYLSVGAEKKLSESLVAGASLNLLRGGRYLNFRTQRGDLFTEANGTYLDLNSDLNIQFAPNDTSKAFESNGLGTSLDLFFRTVKGKSLIEFSIQDLGFISWKEVKQYEGDSTFRYSGQEITDLLSPNSSLISDMSADSMAASVGIKSSVKNQWMWLPARINFSWRYSASEKMTHQVLLRHCFAPGYIPRLQYRNILALHKSFSLVNSVAYGGFGRGDYELGGLVRIQDFWLVSANLHLAEYVVMGKKSSGNGFSLGVTGMF